jgi:diadenosine tetraphosphate (Ap4A) HIT family hydrolase
MKNGDPVICAECERLWSNFQRAMHEHQHLVARLKGDAASVGKAGAAILIQQINDADLARKNAREALEDHQKAAGHH